MPQTINTSRPKGQPDHTFQAIALQEQQKTQKSGEQFNFPGTIDNRKRTINKLYFKVSPWETLQ